MRKYFISIFLACVLVSTAVPSEESGVPSDGFEALVDQVNGLIDSKSYFEAIPLLEKLHELEPDNLDILEVLGCIYSADSNDRPGFSRSFRFLREAEKRFSMNADVYYCLSCIHSCRGELTSAIAYLEKSIARGNSDTAWWAEDPDLENLRKTDWWGRVEGSLVELETAIELFVETKNKDAGLSPEERIAVYGKMRRQFEGMLSPESPIVSVVSNKIAEALYENKDYAQAIENYEKGLAIAIKDLVSESPDVATSYNNVAYCYWEMDDYGKAVELFERSLSIRIKVLGPEHPEVATSYNNLGMIHDSMGQYRRAIDYFERSLSIRTKIYSPDKPELAASYNNLGDSYSSMGEYDTAIDYFTRSLAIFEKEKGPDCTEVATLYNNLGTALYYEGDFDKAIGYFELSLSIEQNIFGPEHPEVATSYNNLGSTYLEKGDLDKAIDYHERALGLRRKLLGPFHFEVATSYNNLAHACSLKGDYTNAAAHYEKSLEILSRANDRHPHTALLYNNLGNVYSRGDDCEKAIEYYDKALTRAQETLGAEHPHVALIHNNLGWSYISTGNDDMAIDHFGRALAIWRKSTNYQDIINLSWGMVKSLLEKKHTFALEAVAVGIESVERARLDLASAKTGIMAKAIPLYYAGVDLSVRDGKTEKAFVYSEALRSRGFLDQMGTEASLRLEGITDEERMRLRDLVATIDGARRELERLNGLATDERDATAVGRAGDALMRAERDLAALDETLGKRIPKYTQLRNPRPVDIAAARQWCGSGRVVLEYVLWDESLEYGDAGSDGAGKPASECAKLTSYCLVLGPAGVEAVPLDGDYDYNSAINKIRNMILWKAGEAKMEVLRNELYKKLIAPVESTIPAGTKSVVIVPDGPLAFLPMDILRKDSASPDFGETYAVSVSPSVSVSALAERERMDRTDHTLAMGGGLYCGEDVHVERGATTRGYTRSGDTESSEFDSLDETLALNPKRLAYEIKVARENDAGAYFAKRAFKWSNLPGTLVEVRLLRDTVFSSGLSTVLEGADASESALKSLSSRGTLAGYDVIHLACHGYFDNMVSEMSSVVLSEVSGLLPDLGEDGYLTVPEIALLRLGASMVNLSACETGLSRVRRGDGMVGLTRSFLVAGARNVGVSLWCVDDEATSAFMKRLYMKVQNGMDYPEAYTAVKNEFREDTRWSHPYYWAAFTMYE